MKIPLNALFPGDAFDENIKEILMGKWHNMVFLPPLLNPMNQCLSNADKIGSVSVFFWSGPLSAISLDTENYFFFHKKHKFCCLFSFLHSIHVSSFHLLYLRSHFFNSLCLPNFYFLNCLKCFNFFKRRRGCVYNKQSSNFLKTILHFGQKREYFI